MLIGLAEIALLLVVSFGAFVASIVGRNWFYLGIAPLFALAVVVTPADPVSTLIVGAPLTLAYGFTIRRLSAGSTSRDS